MERFLRQANLFVERMKGGRRNMVLGKEEGRKDESREC